MLIDRIEFITKTKAKVTFDNGVECILYRSEIRREGLEENKEVPEEQFSSIMKEIVLKRAKKKVMDLLIRSDKTEKELRDKLKRDQYPEFIIEKAIAYVHSYHYINEQNYLENYVKYHSRGKSRIMLVQELTQKGIDRENIFDCLEEFYDEREQVRYLVAKKVRGRLEITPEEKEKISRYLFRKGFKSSDIFGELKKY